MNTTQSEIAEAIALAKAVKQTATANAKVALEERFNEQYSAILANKLKSESATEENQVEDEGITETNIDDLIKELESDIEGSTGTPAGDASMPPAAAGGDAASKPAAAVATPAPEGTVAPEGTPVVQAPVIVVAPASAETEQPSEPAAGAEPELPPSEPATGAGMDEELNLEELLESLKKEIAEEEKEETIKEDTKLKSSGIGGKAGGSNKPAAAASSSSKIETTKDVHTGIPEGEHIVADATDAKRPNEGKNATSTNLSTPKLGGTSGPALKAARPNSGGDFESTAKLNEALTTIKKQSEAINYLKNELNEINLLNAKLLYTNKLFKEHSVDKSQKMRIVEMFDLAKNIREVKMQFASITEALSFSATAPKKAPAKAVPAAKVAAITEGLVTGNVNTEKQQQEIISENAITRARIMELAGIKPSIKK